MGWKQRGAVVLLAGMTGMGACGGKSSGNDELAAEDASIATSAGGSSSSGAGASSASNASTNGGGASAQTATSSTLSTSGAPTVATSGTPTVDVGYRSLTDEEYADLVANGCGWTWEPELLPPALQFVVDVSAGMARSQLSGVRHWDAARDLLLELIPTLPASASVGLSFYPHQPNTTDPSVSCIDSAADVPQRLLASAAVNQVQALEQALQTVVPLEAAGAPTHDAYLAGLAALASAAPLPGTVVLVTDGELNFELGCEGEGTPGTHLDTTPLIADIADAAANGISTLVIGGPGSAETASGMDARAWLSEAAVAGRRACGNPEAGHLAMTDLEPEDLILEFNRQLVAEAESGVGCSFELPTPPAGETIDPDIISVVLQNTGQRYLLSRRESSDCQHGWYLTEPFTIELCPESCSWLGCDGSLRPEVYLQCG